MNLNISVELLSDTEISAESIASYIMGIMGSKGLTKEGLAQKMGTTRQNVHRILSGKDFKVSTLNEIANALGYSLKIEFIPQ